MPARFARGRPPSPISPRHRYRQAAALAKAQGAPEVEIVAALLHDVGWKLAACSPFTLVQMLSKRLHPRAPTPDHPAFGCRRIDAAAGGTLNLSEKASDVQATLQAADLGMSVSDSESLASKLGILSFCGSGSADLEQQRAQVSALPLLLLLLLGFSSWLFFLASSSSSSWGFCDSWRTFAL
jgi:hypothetical protein